VEEKTEIKKENKGNQEYQKELIETGNYHKDDMIFYRMKHPDFDTALKGRKMTLKSFD